MGRFTVDEWRAWNAGTWELRRRPHPVSPARNTTARDIAHIERAVWAGDQAKSIATALREQEQQEAHIRRAAAARAKKAAATRAENARRRQADAQLLLRELIPQPGQRVTCTENQRTFTGVVKKVHPGKILVTVDGASGYTSKWFNAGDVRLSK